jgi:hypothetical protein
MSDWQTNESAIGPPGNASTISGLEIAAIGIAGLNGFAGLQSDKAKAPVLTRTIFFGDEIISSE